MVKQHKNTVVSKQYIHDVVTAFYTKAVSDVVIGYHFRKIATTKGHHPLKPPMEAFADHIPRIVLFWSSQLLQETLPDQTKPFDLISLHQKLSIRLGELGRWITLFKETLHEAPEHDIKEDWFIKLEHFERVFQKKIFNKTS